MSVSLHRICSRYTELKFMIKIKDIVQIQTGIYEKPVAFGEVYYVQARHFDENRNFISTVTPELPLDNKLEKHFLQKGDVLVASKGYDHFAVAYEGIIKPAVASSMFIVLRPKTEISPQYLAWFINHPNTQNILTGNSKGTALPSITKSDIGDLTISIPNLKIQETILKINELRKKEKTLKVGIENLKDVIIQNTILKYLNTDKNNV